MFDVELKFLMYDPDAHASKFLVRVTNGLVSEEKVAWLDMSAISEVYAEDSRRMAAVRFESLKDKTFMKGYAAAMRAVVEYAEGAL